MRRPKSQRVQKLQYDCGKKAGDNAHQAPANDSCAAAKDHEPEGTEPHQQATALPEKHDLGDHPLRP